MQINITARQMRLTQPLKSYVEEKVLKAQKYFNHIIRAQVTLSVEKRAQQAEIVIHAAQQDFRSVAQAGDLYAAVDLASDKIDAQLKKFKERKRDHHRDAAEAEVMLLPEVPRPVRISVIKQVPVRPMTSDEAAAEMDRMGYNFWLFQDRESKHIHVLFRRLDDSYGLLQPVRRGGN